MPIIAAVICDSDWKGLSLCACCDYKAVVDMLRCRFYKDSVQV